MTAIYVVGVPIAVLLVAAFIRISVTAEYSSHGFSVILKILFFTVSLYPGQPSDSKKKQNKKHKNKGAEMPAVEAAPKKKGGKVSFILECLSPVFEALGRIKRRMLINELTVMYSPAALDPADAAINFGRASGAMAALYALIMANFKIKKTDLRTTLDYDAKEPTVYILASLSLAVWEIIYILLSLGIKILGIYKRSVNANTLAETQGKAAQ